MSVNLLLSPNGRTIYSNSITLSKGFSYPDPSVFDDDDIENYSFIDAPDGTEFTAVKNEASVFGKMIYFNVSMIYAKTDDNTNPFKFSITGATLPAYRQVIDLFVTLEDQLLGTVAFVENVNGVTVIDVRYKSEGLVPVQYEMVSNGGIIKITGCYFV